MHLHVHGGNAGGPAPIPALGPDDGGRPSASWSTLPAMSSNLAAQAPGVTVDPDDEEISGAYGYNALKRRVPAHPDVVRVHHPRLAPDRARP